jgi:hypothetical protein
MSNCQSKLNNIGKRKTKAVYELYDNVLNIRNKYNLNPTNKFKQIEQLNTNLRNDRIRRFHIKIYKQNCQYQYRLFLSDIGKTLLRVYF